MYLGPEHRRCNRYQQQATAMRYAAERRHLDESIEELRQIADGRNDILPKPRASLAGLGTPVRPYASVMS